VSQSGPIDDLLRDIGSGHAGASDQLFALLYAEFKSTPDVLLELRAAIAALR